MSQELVMNMFRDQQGMMPLRTAGLMEMVKSGKTDPAVVARVVNLIVNEPVLSQTDQLSANGVNGKPFSIERMDFAAARNQDLRWRISEGSDRMLHPVHIHGCQSTGPRQSAPVSAMAMISSAKRSACRARAYWSQNPPTRVGPGCNTIVYRRACVRQIAI